MSRYHQLDDVLNPCRKPTWLRDDVLFWLESAHKIAQYGLAHLKRTIVEGQYEEKHGLFFGGTALSTEHRQLAHFLTHQCAEVLGVDLCSAAQRVTLVDVHTGLGAWAKDYLFADCSKGTAFETIFADYARMGRIVQSNADGDADAEAEAMSSMYAQSIGHVTSADGYVSLFENASDVLAFAQEFGTVSGVRVLKALRAENMAYRCSRGQSVADERVFYQRGLEVKGVFYLEQDAEWKQSVLRAGVDVFARALRR